MTNPERRESIFQHRLWLAIIVIVAIAFSTLGYFNVPSDNSNDPAIIIGSILGRSFSFLFVPLIFIGLFALIHKLLSKRWIKPSAFLSMYSVLFVIVLVLATAGTYVEQHRNEIAKIKTYSFEPEGSEYSVIFDDVPEISSSTFEIEGLISKTAVLAHIDNGSFQKAESAIFTGDHQPVFTKHRAKAAIREYAASNGLQYPAYQYEETELGKVASVRGYKSLEKENGEEVRVIYEVIMYYGDSTMMALYVGSPSIIYPTPEIMSFLNSIRRK